MRNSIGLHAAGLGIPDFGTGIVYRAIDLSVPEFEMEFVAWIQCLEVQF